MVLNKSVLFILLVLMSSPARADEKSLTGPEIMTALSDQTLVGADASQNIEQIFQKSGLTLYSSNGAQSQGFWKVDGDKYCSQWPPSENWSCYAVVQEGSLITFVSGGGTRYPMRPKEAAQ
jgi:hypothetical protein